MNTLGQRLKKLRQEKEGRPTQKEVAEAIGYTRDTYANWEIDRGEPPHDALRALARFFNCTTDYLLGLTDQPRPEPPQPAKSNGDDDIFAATLAANMEEEYGKKPSPEFLAFAKKLRQQILEDIKKEKGQ